jgi:hypothetical protein
VLPKKKKSSNVIHHTNRLKKKNAVIIATDTENEKAFVKTSTPIYDFKKNTTFSKPGPEGSFSV